MTNQEIAIEQEIVFNQLFTVSDILKGDTIEMNKQARIIAIKNLQKKGK